MKIYILFREIYDGYSWDTEIIDIFTNESTANTYKVTYDSEKTKEFGEYQSNHVHYSVSEFELNET